MASLLEGTGGINPSLLVHHLRRAFQDHQYWRQRLVVLLEGFMLGSGAVIPAFYTDSLDLRPYLLWSVGIYLLSTTAVVLLKHSMLAKNAMITLPCVLSLAALVLRFSPLSLEHLAPHVPIFGALAIFGVIHYEESMGTTRTIAHCELEHHDCSLGSGPFTLDGRSSRSNSPFQPDHPLGFEIPPWSAFDLRYMGPAASDDSYRISSSQGSASSVSNESSSFLSDASSPILGH
ncbi:hypothetical protein BJ875DRAFT_52195 [Amylocarpus encephaloides]|uniref:Uncharacterized protein n=1 Tax=Amylocarpus encephaloides TaxID=45428 RepID=A0A9P7YHF9_9HELO|nr:hypothetical protein BJ875DRAFT_52195 [Amylocarpus encephaloides]